MAGGSQKILAPNSREPEDILAGRVVKISGPAANLGVTVGMTGLEAVLKMMKRP